MYIYTLLETALSGPFLRRRESQFVGQWKGNWYIFIRGLRNIAFALAGIWHSAKWHGMAVIYIYIYRERELALTFLPPTYTDAYSQKMLTVKLRPYALCYLGALCTRRVSSIYHRWGNYSRVVYYINVFEYGRYRHAQNDTTWHKTALMTLDSLGIYTEGWHPVADA